MLFHIYLDADTPITSHYLRPSRTYILGRHPIPYVDPKNPTKSVVVKPKMRDFTVNPASTIPRKGPGSLILGEWTEVDAVSLFADSSSGGRIANKPLLLFFFRLTMLIPIRI